MSIEFGQDDLDPIPEAGDWLLEMTFVDDDDVPVDLTGAEVRVVFADDFDRTIKIDKKTSDAGDDLVILDADSGRVDCKLVPADTVGMGGLRLLVEARIRTADGRILTALDSAVDVLQSAIGADVT